MGKIINVYWFSMASQITFIYKIRQLTNTDVATHREIACVWFLLDVNSFPLIYYNTLKYVEIRTLSVYVDLILGWKIGQIDFFLIFMLLM